MNLPLVLWENFYSQSSYRFPRLGIPFQRASQNVLQYSLRLEGLPKEVPIQQNSKSIGGVVWDAGLVLSDFIVHYVHHERQSLGRVLDLGTGTGISGMIAGLLGASFVVFNDLCLSDELSENLKYLSTLIPSSHFQIELFDWLSVPPQVVEALGHFDHVLCSDCIYDEKLHPGLLSLLEKLQFHTLIICFKRRFDTAERQFFEALSAFVQIHEFPVDSITSLHMDPKLLEGVHLFIGCKNSTYLH